MSDSVKVALIPSVAILLATTIAVSALIYFSPYQSCMRQAAPINGMSSNASFAVQIASLCAGGSGQ